MKKRVLSLLLALVLLSALLPQTALVSHAAASGSCGENLTWSFDEETGTLTVTGSGAMTKWSTAARVPWDGFRAGIQSVVLPEGLTNVGNLAFYCCENLNKVTLPASVTEIGSSAFYGCAALTSINMPAGLKTIKSFSFFRTGLMKVTIPAGVSSLGDSAFKECPNLAEATIRNKITGYNVFRDCTALTKVTFTGKPTRIMHDMFHGCAVLESVTIPGSVKTIESSAFQGCTGLKELQIQSGLEFLERSAFMDCSSLRTAFLPESVRSIQNNAFKNCTALKNITVVNPYCTIDSYKCTLGEPGTTTVHGYAGSTAEKRAKQHGFTFSTTVNALPRPVVKTGNDAMTGNIKLTWKAVDGAVEYQVYRAFASSTASYSLIGTTKSLSFVDTTAKMYWDPEYYYYRVKAVASDMVSNSGCSVTKKAAVLFACPDVSAAGEKNSDGTYLISMKWQKVKEVQSYEIYRATTKDGTYKKIYTVDGTDYINYPDGKFWFKDRNVTLGNTYYYKFRSADEEGHTSLFSPVLTVKCGLARPVVTASNLASTGKIKLSWKKVPNAVNYKIYRASSKTGSYQLVKTTTSLNWTDTSAAAGKTYYYKVKAVASNSKANSLYSLIVSRTCKLARPEVTVKRTSAGKPKLSWKAVSGAEGYEVFRSEQPAGSFALIRTVTSGTTYTNTGAEAGKTYYYKIRAISSRTEANSAFSAVAGITAK